MEPARTLIDALNAAPAERTFVTYWVDEDEHEEVTFGEFRRRAQAQAKALVGHGVEAGDRVVIIMPQSIAAMTTFVGAMMLGAVPAILAYPNFKIEPAKYASGLSGVSANLAAKLVLVDEQFPDELLGHVTSTGDARLVRIGGNVSADSMALPAYKPSPDSVAFIQHSAGTTGLQKGVALTHRAVLTQIGHLSEALHVDGTTDRIYSWLPLYHDMGLIACFMLPMVCHVPLVMQSPMDWVMQPGTMLEVITALRCTLGWLPNFAFQFLPRRVPHSRWSQCDLSSVRALINCSEPVRASSIREFREAFSEIGLRTNVLQSSYAMAENVFAVTQSVVSRPDGPLQIWVDGQRFRTEHRAVVVEDGALGATPLVSSGRLLPGCSVRIVAEDGAPLPEGHVGEILVASDCLFEGYFNRPGLTTEVLRDGWYRTGDLGFLYEGELFVVGRKKDLLIIGGENLYPQDLEELVASHSSIHDGRVVAMGIYNPSLGTEDIVVVAEIESEDLLENAASLELELRSRVVAGLGVAVRTVYLKPPKWIVKSTAGKPSRAGTRDKLLREHPELNAESQEIQVS